MPGKGPLRKRARDEADPAQPSRGASRGHFRRYTMDELETMAQDPRSAVPIMQSQGHQQGPIQGYPIPSDDGEAARPRKRKRGQKYRSVEELIAPDVGVPDQHDDKEAADRRAKNREAARKSRERKALHTDSLEKANADLQHENGMLAKCVQEISAQAVEAEEETNFVKEQIRAIRAMAATPADQAVIDQLLENAIALARSRPPRLPRVKAHPPMLATPPEEHPSRAVASPELLRCREPPLAASSPDPLFDAPEPADGCSSPDPEDPESLPLLNAHHCDLYLHEAALLPLPGYAAPGHVF